MPSLSALFEAAARTSPQSTAVVAGDQRLTFMELDRLANELAHRLTRKLRVGDRVGLRCGRSAELAVAILGIWKAGAAYLPIDPEDPSARVSRMLTQVPTALVVDSWSRPWPNALCYSLERAGKLGETQGPQVLTSDEDRAYTMFTSGSTGVPLAVDVRHGSVTNLWSGLNTFFSRALERPLRRVAMNAPHTFDASVKQLIQLLSGCTLYVLDEPVRRDPSAFLAYMEAEQIDLVDITPSHLRLLIASDPSLTGLSKSCLLIGGEAIDKSLVEALQQSRVGSFAGVYGPTECCVDATAATRTELPGLGRPLRGVDVWVCDEHGGELSNDTAGEIVIGGRGVADGYLNSPALTAQRFIPRPDGRHGHAFRTGDIGIRNLDGTFSFLGRQDDLVKIGGRRVHLQEIVKVLTQSDSVANVAVVPDDDLAPLTLHAFIVPARSGDEAIHGAREQAERWLPPSLRPAELTVIPVLPLTRHGKVDRHLLMRATRTSHPSPSTVGGRGTLKLVLTRFGHALGRDDIGPDDDFFALGGDSIAAVRLVRGLEKETGRAIRLVRFVAEPTPRRVAAFLDAQGQGREEA